MADELGTVEYPRLSIGVGRGDTRRDLADHVLARFEPEEQSGIESAIARAADAVETLGCSTAWRQTMNSFNRATTRLTAPCHLRLGGGLNVHKEAHEQRPTGTN